MTIPAATKSQKKSMAETTPEVMSTVQIMVLRPRKLHPIKFVSRRTDNSKSLAKIYIQGFASSAIPSWETGNKKAEERARGRPAEKQYIEGV
jgi:hypothetical protein